MSGRGPCAKQVVRATIIAPDGRRFVGENDCARPQKTCPREGLPTGAGYHLCVNVCGQTSHAEVAAIARAGEAAQGAVLYLEGHSYACADCRIAGEAAGLAEIRIENPPPPALPAIIGLCGRAGAGKTSAARILVERHDFVRTRFAGPLKAMMRGLGLSEAEVDGPLKEKPCALLGGKTPRAAMQWLGTEWGRDRIDERLWLRAWERETDSALEAAKRVVVDDVRFPNEAAAIKARGGVLVRIVTAHPPLAAAHASELQLIEADAEIFNAHAGFDDLSRNLSATLALSARWISRRGT